MENFKKWFDEFEDSEEAQEFCFSNYNNYTRDHQVGEFCAKNAWEKQQRKIDSAIRILKQLQKLPSCSRTANAIIRLQLKQLED